MYELFDHTADLGLRIRSGELNGLFEEAGRALFSVLLVDLGSVRPTEEVTLRIKGDRRDELLFDWLAELLYLFNAGRLLLVRFEVHLDSAGLTATARGEKIDPARHEIDTEIKAITYHQLKVEQQDDGWLAEVIVDI